MRVWSFLFGTVTGIVIAQTYDLPHWEKVYAVFKDFEKTQRKK